MKRFAITSALALALGLALASTADAQYAYRYNVVTPSGGVVTNAGVGTLFGSQQYHSYTSPFGATYNQSFYSSPLGNYGYSNGLNPWTGYGYNRGFYQPNPFVLPYGGAYYNYGYNMYGRRW